MYSPWKWVYVLSRFGAGEAAQRDSPGQIQIKAHQRTVISQILILYCRTLFFDFFSSKFNFSSGWQFKLFRMSNFKQHLREVSKVTGASVDSLTPDQRKQRSMYMGKGFNIKWWYSQHRLLDRSKLDIQSFAYIR